jgi:hypothetical protein
MARKSVRLTILDAMVMVAAAAIGCWAGSTLAQLSSWFNFFSVGHAMPLLLRVVLTSFPFAVAMTIGLLVVPFKTLRERTRRPTRQPGTAISAAAVVVFFGMLIRWLLFASTDTFSYNPPFPYSALALIDCARWCGLGVISAATLIALTGRFRTRGGWIERIRLALGGYWIVAFLVVSPIR